MAEKRLSQLAAYDERLRNQQSTSADDEAMEALSPELTKAMRALRDALTSAPPSTSRETILAAATSTPQPADANTDLSFQMLKPTMPERFEFIAELGSGGFGIVYQAYDTWLKRDVAIKFLRPELITQATVRQRFLRESRAAARLNHPFIVRVLEVSESPENIWQVCELVTGAPLSQHIAHGSIEPPVAARLALDLADAVAHAHACDVLHRDIKPDNILVDCQPGQPLHSATLRLTDFGLARLTNIDATLLSHTGMLVGTPRYMAPEQLTGKVDEHGPGIDIYAIGIVLYEMLSGSNPFNDVSSLHERLAKIQQPITYVRKLAPQVPRDLATICHKCLESQPDRRYRSAAELRDDLDRFLRGDPTIARPLPVHERLWRWSSRHRASAGIMAVLLITSCLIFVQTLRNNSIYRQQNSLLSEVNQQLSAQELHSRDLANLAETLRQEAISKQERFADLAWKKGIREAYTAWHGRSYPEARELLASLAESHTEAKSRIEWRLLKADIDRQIKTLMALPGSLNEVRSIPHTTNVAVAASDGTIYIVNAIDGQTVGKIVTDIPTLHALAVSPDGRWLATGGSVRVDVDLAFPKIYDLGTLQLVKQLPGQETTLESLEFSADSQHLAVGCRYSTVKVYDCTTEAVIELPSDRRNLWLSASPTSNHFATHATGNTIAISNINSPADLKKIEQPYQINCAAWLASGLDLVFACKLLRSTSITTSESNPRTFLLNDVSATIEVTALASDRGILAAGLLTGEVLLWQDDPDDTNRLVAPIAAWKLSNVPIHSLAIQGEWILAATHEGQLIRVRTPMATPKPPHTEIIQEVLTKIASQANALLSWNPNGKGLLATKHSGEVCYIDLDTGRLLDVISDPQVSLTYSRSHISLDDHHKSLLPALPLEVSAKFKESRAADLASDQQAWAYGRGSQVEAFGSWPSEQQQISIFRQVQEERDHVDFVKFSPDNRQLAWTGSDARVHVITLSKPDHQVQSSKLKGQGQQLAWSNNGDRIAVGGQLPVLEFNPTDGQMTEIIDYGMIALCLAYNSENHIISGHRDGTIRIVDPQTREARILQVHSQEVRSLLITADGRIGISLDIDANIGLWFTHGETIGLLPHDPTGDFGRFYLSPQAWTDSKSILKVAYNDFDGDLLIDTWNLEAAK